MGFLDNLLKPLGYSKQQKAVELPALFNGTRLFHASQLGNQKAQLMAYSDWVYAAARAIAEGLGAFEPRIYVNRTATKSGVVLHRINTSQKYLLEQQRKQVQPIKRDGKIIGYAPITKIHQPALEEVDNHILLDLLHAPNKFMTKDEFFELTALHMELAGEAFWTIIRDGQGTPVELWPLMPDKVKVVPDPELFIKGYTYKTPNGNDLPLESDDVIHHKYSNPNNLYRGQSIVQAAARAIDTDTHAADYNKTFFQNRAQVDAVLETDETLTTETFERLKTEWNDTYGGASNAHKTALLEAGLKYKPIALSQKDMDFLQARKFNRDQILALFRVSASILGISENVNRANAEAAEFTFAKHVMKPKMLRLATRITEDLAVQFDSKLIVGFTDPVPEDKEFVLKEKQASLDKWRTINEVRAESGQDPVDNGDVLYRPLSEFPLGSADLLPEEPDTIEESLKVLAEGQSALAKQIANLEKKKYLYKNNDERIAIGEGRVEVTRRIATTYEALFLRKSRALFDKQKEEVLRNIKKLPLEKATSAHPIKAKLPELFDKKGAIKKFAVAFKPIYEQTTQAAGSDAMLLLGLTGFDNQDPAIQKFIIKRAGRIAKDINLETDKQLRATITEGMSKGEGIDKIADRVEDVYGSAAGYRAQRIAQTETTRSASFATEEAWDQSGQVEGKEWYTAKDELVCPFCGEEDGKIVELDTAFHKKDDDMSVQDENGKEHSLKFTYEDVEGPPLHVNCRCVMLPVLKDI